MKATLFYNILCVCNLLLTSQHCFAYGADDITSTNQNAYVKIKKNSEDVKWRKTPLDSDQNEMPWNAVSNQTQISSDTEIQTGPKGSLEMQFSEGSEIKISSQTTIALQSLQDPQNQPLIWINLKTGLITLKIAPYNSYRDISVFTPSAVIIPEIGFPNVSFNSETLPTFSIKQDQNEIQGQSLSNLTTVAVNKGFITIQFENPNFQAIRLTPNEQISFNESTLGPVVIAGATPTLLEPKELKYRILDLGTMEVCETLEGNSTENCGSWQWNKEKQYFEATWQNGEKSHITVEKMNEGKIIFNREDIEGPNKGLVLIYIGHDQGTEIQGDVAIQILGGSITSKNQEKITKGTWRARSSYFLNLNE